jgi:TolA-binding protein
VADERLSQDPALGPRWTEGPLVGRAREAEAIELFRAATSMPGFSAVSSQRIWRRLNAARPGRRWLRPAVILGLALAATGAAAASLAVMRSLSKSPAPPLSSPAVRRGSATAADRFTPAPQPLVIRASDVPALAPGPAKHATRPRRLHVTPAAKRTAVSPDDPGTLGKETTLFREALSLRAAHNPRAAIAVLDHYADVYPQGSYAAEVMVLRGELAADDGDCAAALRDFNRALIAPASPGLEERALYGRAACHQRAGDRSATRADFQRYLDRFPAGRWSEHARAALH